MSVVTCEDGHPLYEQFAHNPEIIKYLGLNIQVESGPWFATKWKKKAKAFAEDFCQEYHNKFCFLIEKHGAICIWLEKKKAELNQVSNKQLTNNKKQLENNNEKLMIEQEIVSSSVVEEPKTQVNTNQEESLEASLDDHDPEFAKLWAQLEAVFEPKNNPEKKQSSHGYPKVTSISDSYGRVSKLSIAPKTSDKKKKLPEVVANNPVSESIQPERRFRRRYRGVAY